MFQIFYKILESLTNFLDFQRIVERFCREFCVLYHAKFCEMFETCEELSKDFVQNLYHVSSEILWNFSDSRRFLELLLRFLRFCEGFGIFKIFRDF